MKRLVRDLLTLGALLLVTLAMDRAGVYHALAALLEPTQPSWEAGLSMESAAYLPPKQQETRPEKHLPLLPDMAAADTPELAPTETPEPTPTPEPRPLPTVRNGCRTQVDYRAILSEGWQGGGSDTPPVILILHTHSCESYTPESPENTVSNDYRSLNEAESVIAVGDALAETLESLGCTVLHDRSLYDYPSYNGAYDRSGAAVEQWLAAYPEIQVVIDLHRDSLGGRRTEYILPDGSSAAQVMLLLTTGENGLSHPEWKQNLALGLTLQSELEYRYPGLARELYLSPARYNQHLCTGSMLVEVGTEQNTLTEAKLAAVLLGECLAGVLNGSG